MTSFPANGGKRGRLRHRLLLVWAACTVLCAGVAWSQTETAATPGDAPKQEARVDTSAYQQRIDSTTQQFGKNSLPTAEAYSDLADAQRHAGQHDLATQNYVAAIEIYRSVDGPFTPLTIPLLMNLGDNYREAHDGINAVSAYTEARTVSRRIYGLLNEEQLPMLDKLSATLLELNKPVDAEAQQVEALRLSERTWPPESDQGLAAVYKYASWLRDRWLFQFERDQYDRARRVIEEHYGKKDHRLVTPLLGIGNSFRNQRTPDGQGLGALQEALEILVAQPTKDSLAIATALRDLGDWQVAFDRTGYSGAEYRRAWQLLDEVPYGDRLRREWFTGPVFVLREPIVIRGLSEDPNAPNGHVLVRFDLDRNGVTSNVVIIESEPAGLMDEAVSRQVKRSRFRPQLADGEVVSGEGLGLRLTFQYKPVAEAGNNDASKEKKRSRGK
jgi:TonB family protein